jgi:hypothetical protein
MERELRSTQENFRAVEARYGSDMVGLTIAARYVANLLERPKIVHFLEENHPEILTEFRTILSATSMDDLQPRRPEPDQPTCQINSDPQKNAPSLVPRRGQKWQRSTSAIVEPTGSRRARPSQEIVGQRQAKTQRRVQRGHTIFVASQRATSSSRIWQASQQQPNKPTIPSRAKRMGAVAQR